MSARAALFSKRQQRMGAEPLCRLGKWRTRAACRRRDKGRYARALPRHSGESAWRVVFRQKAIDEATIIILTVQAMAPPRGIEGQHGNGLIKGSRQ